MSNSGSVGDSPAWDHPRTEPADRRSCRPDVPIVPSPRPPPRTGKSAPPAGWKACPTSAPGCPHRLSNQHRRCGSLFPSGIGVHRCPSVVFLRPRLHSAIHRWGRRARERVDHYSAGSPSGAKPAIPWSAGDGGEGRAVGTANRTDRRGDRFDTPTLVECWRTGPYLHDGAAVTIEEVLTTRNAKDEHGRTSHLAPAEIHDLKVYVLSL